MKRSLTFKSDQSKEELVGAIENFVAPDVPGPHFGLPDDKPFTGHIDGDTYQLKLTSANIDHDDYDLNVNVEFLETGDGTTVQVTLNDTLQWSLAAVVLGTVAIGGFLFFGGDFVAALAVFAVGGILIGGIAISSISEKKYVDEVTRFFESELGCKQTG
jgi:hypothetical protein